MFKANLSNAIVSKGYEGKDAVRIHKNDAGETTVAEFSVFTSVYDSKAEDKKRFVTIRAKAFGKLAERIEKMKIKEGSSVNISGRLDEDKYEKDDKTVRYNYVLIDDIEYNGSGKKKDGDEAKGGTSEGATAPASDDEEILDDDLPF